MRLKVSKIKHVSGYTKDSVLQSHQGRVIIYDNMIAVSRGNSPDHLGLITKLAAKYRFKKDDVISNAIRMYYAIENDVVILSVSTNMDLMLFEKKAKEYSLEVLLQLRGDHKGV